MPGDPLAPLLELPGVADGVAATRAAVDALLANRALRRRSADVSAESSLRGAWASAALSGVYVSLDSLRSGAAVGDPVVQ
ncbi:MAG: oxidoreductase, partial [Actinomycetota bacterium]|nr:oxidoreductase [Actinomycetota bacterium]